MIDYIAHVGIGHDFNRLWSHIRHSTLPLGLPQAKSITWRHDEDSRRTFRIRLIRIHASQRRIVQNRNPTL